MPLEALFRRFYVPKLLHFYNFLKLQYSYFGCLVLILLKIGLAPDPLGNKKLFRYQELTNLCRLGLTEWAPLHLVWYIQKAVFARIVSLSGAEVFVVLSLAPIQNA